MSESRIGLLIEPLDPLLFRDGRAFGPAGHAESTLPMPHTVAGALRTWMLRRAGFDFTKNPAESFSDRLAQSGDPLAIAAQQARFRGPWFAIVHRERPEEYEPLVPAPANLLQLENGGELIRLDPLETKKLPGWDPPEPGMLPLWPRGKPPQEKNERLEAAYLTREGLEAFLAGETPKADHIKKAEELFGHDRRVGIAVSPQTHATVTEQIYSVSLLALKQWTKEEEKVCFYEEIAGDPDALGQVLPNSPIDIPLGGEGRRALVRRVPAIQWPEAEPRDGQRPLLLLITPGLFDKNPAQGTDEERRKPWRPTQLRDHLAAAAVPGHVGFSGWDLARRGPKPTRFAVKPGSVYFLPKTPERKFVKFGCIFSNPKDVPQGWGAFVKGVWNHV